MLASQPLARRSSGVKLEEEDKSGNDSESAQRQEDAVSINAAIRNL